MASGDARPVPIRATAYRVTFPILDADGDLVVGATGLDSEVSKDGGTMADCASEATEILAVGGAIGCGMYYLDLSSAEMTADCVVVIVKTTTSGAKTVPIVLYPQDVGDIKVDNQSIAGDSTSSSNLAKTTRAIGRGTASGTPSTTSIPTSALTPSSASTPTNAYVGRIVTFDADTTSAALRGQSTDITASTSGATPTLTVTALTTVPASGDTFSVT